jgi:hypothetical protein
MHGVSAHSCGKLLIAAINAPMPFETLPPIGVELSYIDFARPKRVEVNYQRPLFYRFQLLAAVFWCL